jgi:hypothetical protein
LPHKVGDLSNVGRGFRSSNDWELSIIDAQEIVSLDSFWAVDLEGLPGVVEGAFTFILSFFTLHEKQKCIDQYNKRTVGKMNQREQLCFPTHPVVYSSHRRT